MPRRLNAGAVLCTAAFLGTALPSAAQPELRGTGLTPYVATYSITRGSFRLGEMTMTLAAPQDGVWMLTSSSKATGIASLFTDVSIEEHSTFRIEGGLPVPLTHEYKMPGSKKNRNFSLAFDWVERVVSGDVRGEMATEPLAPGAVDRHTTPLAVALAVAGARELPYEFVMIDRARTRHYHATYEGEAFIETPNGKLSTVRVLLTRVGEPERRFQFWFAPALDHLPARIRSVDDDGDTVTLQLISYKGTP